MDGRTGDGANSAPNCRGKKVAGFIPNPVLTKTMRFDDPAGWRFDCAIPGRELIKGRAMLTPEAFKKARLL